ncbi:LPXTG cell wall anchor domain-containing protein [Lactobacillus kefiranofaciens]|uniref:Anchor n=1 Tax=Lactobacillus kefiranofaciens TaxID=267818 RepID=A0AAX3UGG5_9LACO|nr:LPXTG cell wall anchor domain-containing protein [Lactobacillus kefiranofaciens]AEG39872.1 Adhension protein [Lactobacillus kefiranofaciens subsp. kefiranofaciens]WGO86777.1 LPXTG cell wall anchor domain-containing protein [Lactobacillus kefiranofaciens]WQH35906.1 LPXTG cell wall anchor domain-containing protein [Lactobacillus kefiranofaciens]SDA50344.1 anchor [Lactobacillus kefiranofaciens]
MNTVAPHGEKIDKVHTVAPHGQRFKVNRNVTVPRAQSVNTVKSNSQHSELPQTGNDQQTNAAASILGGAAAAIGMIGLAGEKKRKKN